MEEPMDDNSFEDFLKGRLQNYEEDPAENAWDNIFAAISQEDTIPPAANKSWFGNKWWLLVALVFWMIPEMIHQETPVFSDEKIVTTQPIARANVGEKSLSDKTTTVSKITKRNTSVKKNEQKRGDEESINKKDNRKDKKIGQGFYLGNNKTKLSKKYTAAKPPIAFIQSTNITNNMPKDISPQRTKKRRKGKKPLKTSISSNVIKKVIIKNDAQPKKRITHTTIATLKKGQLEYMTHKPTKTEFVPIQPKAVQSERSRNLFVKLFVSPTYNHRRLLTNKEDNVIIQEVESNGFFTRNNIGYSTGIMLESQLNKRWGITLGVTFTQLNDLVSYRYRNVLPDSLKVDFVAGDQVKVSPVFNIDTRSYQYQYQDIGVQMGFNYILYNQSWKHQLYLGFAANQATKTISRTDETTITENSSRFQSMINVGYEVRIQLNQRLGFYAKPMFNYYLNTVNQANEAYQVKPFFTAVRLGFVWRLR